MSRSSKMKADAGVSRISMTRSYAQKSTSPIDVITDVRTRSGNVVQMVAGVAASITMDDALPPSTRPVIARLRTIGHVSRRNRASRVTTMIKIESAVNGD